MEEKELSKAELTKFYTLLLTAKNITEIYEANKAIVSKYVHATSRGHEVIQIACGMNLTPQDYVYPYYRDDAMLLSMGFTPYELMLQVLSKKTDIFSGGRTYYSHPSYNSSDKPKIPHQSSATGMQAIPATGAAMGLAYKISQNISNNNPKKNPIVVCSLGDASCTEGEVSEAFQMAVLKKLPIVYLIQDNEWDISANAKEIRAQDITYFAKGFKGLKTTSIDGTNAKKSFRTIQRVFKEVRKNQSPQLIHAKVPLLNHHTSGVRMEFYRDDIPASKLRDPLPKIEKQILKILTKDRIDNIKKTTKKMVEYDYQKALKQPNPKVEDLTKHILKETSIKEEKGLRQSSSKLEILMVDAALYAIKEIMEENNDCLLYGQDVGKRLGGVFREAATLAEIYGDDRVFNTPIQEAFIVGSTAGMSAVGLRPIVEVQFADYIWPGLNQLFSEISRSYYLSNGKWAVSMVLRVPTGAYGSGGPYHSSSLESVVTNIRGIKVVYPSNAADMKGLMKAAFYDPNPVVIFEHKGLYWSKVKGTENAKSIEPDKNYVIPIGKASITLKAQDSFIKSGNSLLIISYGMSIHKALQASKYFKNQIEILDLRSLSPIDYETIFKRSKIHGKIMLITEETSENTFTNALAGKIQAHCFNYLDAPIKIIASVDTPAIPLNEILEIAYLPSIEEIIKSIKILLDE